MRTRFVLLIAFILTLTLTCSEAGSKKQASRNARVDLKELEKKYEELKAEHEHHKGIKYILTMIQELVIHFIFAIL